MSDYEIAEEIINHNSLLLAADDITVLDSDKMQVLKTEQQFMFIVACQSLNYPVEEITAKRSAEIWEILPGVLKHMEYKHTEYQKLERKLLKDKIAHIQNQIYADKAIYSDTHARNA